MLVINIEILSNMYFFHIWVKYSILIFIFICNKHSLPEYISSFCNFFLNINLSSKIYHLSKTEIRYNIISFRPRLQFSRYATTFIT